MRRLFLFSSFLFSLLSACAPTAPAAPPLASPPPSTAPAAAGDTLDAASAAHRMPPAERPWRGPEYAAAAAALRELASGGLPRAGSAGSGALFARLVNAENVDFARDLSVPLDTRFPALLDVQSHANQVLRVYIEARAKAGGLDHEVLALLAFAVHTTAVQWDLVDELLVRLDPADPTYGTRLGGMDRGRLGTGEIVEGVLQSLAEPYPRAEIALFARAIADDFAELCRRVTPANEAAARGRLERLAAAEPPGEARQAIAALRVKLDAPPAADVTITAAAIFGRDKSAALVTLPADRSLGVAPADKGGGADSFAIAALHRAMEAIKPLRRAVVEVDPTTPYRLLVEVLFTLGQADVPLYELRLLGQPARHFAVRPPRLVGPSPSRLGLHLTAWVVGAGVGLKTAAGNVAPGCNGAGPGITVPRAGGHHDVAGVRACAQRLKALTPAEREVIVVGNAAVPASDLFAVVAALRGDALEVFPDVFFGVSR